jgi:hypothetical protein
MKQGMKRLSSIKGSPVSGSVCTLSVSFCLSLLAALSFAGATEAEDWGYDGSQAAPPPSRVLEEQSAASLVRSLVKPDKKAAPAVRPGTKTTGTAKPADSKSKTQNNQTRQTPSALPAVPANPDGKMPAKGTSAAGADDPVIDKDMQAARCWLQLFQACCKQAADYTQQKRMESYVLGRERQGGKSRQEFQSVLAFWPRLMNDLRNRPEMEMHYADLFKALLRLHERSSKEKTNVEGSTYSCDADLISELLGLERTAAEGEPGEEPFTEDAVNAYADMAVFIYEQNHAGRTIDANDNRTIFAKVVVEKFNRAPTAADRRAMANFDLSWAKFKVVWFSSDEKTQKALLEKLVKTGASSTLTVAKDPLLDLVLSNWPWKTTP